MKDVGTMCNEFVTIKKNCDTIKVYRKIILCDAQQQLENNIANTF